MKKIISLLFIILLFIGCSKSEIKDGQEKKVIKSKKVEIIPRPIEKECITKDCIIDHCIYDGEDDCRMEIEGMYNETIKELNTKYTDYQCEWAINNMSNVGEVFCYKK